MSNNDTKRLICVSLKYKSHTLPKNGEKKKKKCLYSGKTNKRLKCKNSREQARLIRPRTFYSSLTVLNYLIHKNPLLNKQITDVYIYVQGSFRRIDV